MVKRVVPLRCTVSAMHMQGRADDRQSFVLRVFMGLIRMQCPVGFLALRAYKREAMGLQQAQARKP